MKKSIKKSIKKLVSLLCMTCVLAGGVTVAHATDGTAVTNEPIIIKSTTDEGAINDNFVQIKGVYKVKNCEWSKIKPEDEEVLASFEGIFKETDIIPSSASKANANWRAIFDLSTYSGKYEVYFLNLNSGTGADKTGTDADMEAHIEIVDKNGKTVLASYKPIEKGNGEWINCGIHELVTGSSLTIYRDTDGAANLRITAVKLVPTEAQINDVNIEAQINDVNYESFQDAIDAANEAVADSTTNAIEIDLLADVTSNADITINSGATLDLNGKTLEVKYAATFGGKVVDSSGDKTGLLKVAEDQFIFSTETNNPQMPVYNGTDGYVFADIVMQTQRNSVKGADIFELVFRPSLGTGKVVNNTLLANGGNAAKVSIGIRLEWTDAEGKNPQSKELWYADDMVAEVYKNTKAFYITASGVNSFSNLKITPLVQSQLKESIIWYDSNKVFEAN